MTNVNSKTAPPQWRSSTSCFTSSDLLPLHLCHQAVRLTPDQTSSSSPGCSEFSEYCGGLNCLVLRLCQTGVRFTSRTNVYSSSTTVYCQHRSTRQVITEQGPQPPGGRTLTPANTLLLLWVIILIKHWVFASQPSLHVHCKVQDWFDWTTWVTRFSFYLYFCKFVNWIKVKFKVARNEKLGQSRRPNWIFMEKNGGSWSFFEIKLQ